MARATILKDARLYFDIEENKRKEMEDKNIPYIVYESEAARHERTVKRLLMVIVFTLALLVATNMAWLYVFNQYDFSSESCTIEGQDNANANYLESGVDGVINNGE